MSINWEWEDQEKRATERHLEFVRSLVKIVKENQLDMLTAGDVKICCSLHSQPVPPAALESAEVSTEKKDPLDLTATELDLLGLAPIQPIEGSNL